MAPTRSVNLCAGDANPAPLSTGLGERASYGEAGGRSDGIYILARG